MPRAKKTPPPASAPAPAPAPAQEGAAPGAALLAVDLQSTLLGALPSATARAVSARAGLALSAAVAFRIPVVFTEQIPAKLGPTAPALRKLAPEAEVFAKNTFSAVADESVLSHLRSREIEHLLLIGLETPICIYQTALGALAEGFQVTVLSDAVAARRADDHAACLSALRHAGVHVLPVETVAYALLHDATHPLFRTFTALVKAHA
ncbi:MAG: isochorismatase family protein [Opitutaceae bacterium]|nr:isochorismatase family protein [Opitutaceae bacterium]